MRKLIGVTLFAALALPPMLAWGASKTSLFGTTVTSTNQQIVDGQFNVWMLSGGKAYKNSVVTPSSGVILLVYYDGIVYQENSAHLWWGWLNGAWVAMTDPRKVSAGSTTIPYQTHLVDASHTVWTLSGGQIYANGYVKASSGVIELLYAKGTVYQENLHHDWWVWSNGGWVATTAPDVASSSGTSVPSSAELIDSQLKTWTLSGGKAYVNGVATPSASVTLLLYYNGSVYQENVNHNWWQWKTNAWVAIAADPRVPALAAAAGFKTLTFDSTALGKTSGTWQISNLNNSSGCTHPAVQNDDGSFTVPSYTNQQECYLTTAIKNASGANGWTGVTFKPGMYVKLVLSYVGTNPGVRNGGLPGNVPGFWATAIEHADGGKKSNGALLDQWPGQAPNYEHWMQVDFFAAFCSSGDSPGSSQCRHDANQDSDLFFTNVDDWSGTSSSLSEFQSTGGADLQNGQTWATSHTLEYVWVAASDSAFGHFDSYVDGVKYENGAQSWPLTDPTVPPTNYQFFYSVGDTQNMVFVTGSGIYADLTVHSVQVWQGSSSGMTKQ